MHSASSRMRIRLYLNVIQLKWQYGVNKEYVPFACEDMDEAREPCRMAASTTA